MVAALAVLVLCMSTGVDAVLAQASGITRIPLIVAHRGGQERFPAGSLDSFLGAAAEGYPVEMDLRTLDDGGIAISHDSTTGETTEDSDDVPVDSLSTDDWTSMCLRYDSERCFHAVTFGQVLDALPGNALLVVENKQDEVDLERLERILAARSLTSSTLIESLDFGEVTQASVDGIITDYPRTMTRLLSAQASADDSAGVPQLRLSAAELQSRIRRRLPHDDAHGSL